MRGRRARRGRDRRATISRVMPSSGESDADELMTAVITLAAMPWQYAHPADTLRLRYEENHRLVQAMVDFVLRRTLMAEHSSSE